MTAPEPPPVQLWFAQLAPRLRANGFSCLPVEPASKVTREKGWSRFCREHADARTFANWLKTCANYSVAIACGDVIAIDIDLTDPLEVEAAVAVVHARLGATELVRVGQAPKRILLYRTAGPLRSRKVGAIDILANGRYFLAFGIHPLSGQPYFWLTRSPVDLPLSALAVVTAAQIDALCDDLLELQGSPRPREANNDRAPHPKAVDGAGLVHDGREALLTSLVFAAWCSGLDTAEAIADQAWSQVARRAELTRPKRDGALWSRADALVKAKYLLGRGLKRPPRSPARLAKDTFWTAERNRQFQTIVYAIAASGRLSPSAVKVSVAMLAYVRGNDVCWASVERLVSDTGLLIDTFKRARRELCRAKLWTCIDPGGGVGRSAHYTPNRQSLTWPHPFSP